MKFTMSTKEYGRVPDEHRINIDGYTGVAVITGEFIVVAFPFGDPTETDLETVVKVLNE